MRARRLRYWRITTISLLAIVGSGFHAAAGVIQFAAEISRVVG